MIWKPMDLVLTIKEHELMEKETSPDIKAQFKKRETEKFEDRKAKCFFVPIEEIEENDFDLSISRYKEIEYEEVIYEEPKVIKQKIT